MFNFADALSHEFPPMEQHLTQDDICVQGNDGKKVIYWYAIPPHLQKRQADVAFFNVLNRLIGRHAL